MNADELTDAAFWHKWVCLECEGVLEEEEAKAGDECPLCGERALARAERLASMFGSLGDEE